VLTTLHNSQQLLTASEADSQFECFYSSQVSKPKCFISVSSQMQLALGAIVRTTSKQVQSGSKQLWTHKQVPMLAK
jgi:hypothetical protein